MHESHAKKISSALGRAGLRNTTATRQVIDVFSQARERLLAHADVDAILKRKKLTLDKVTLYRLLDRLVTAGLLHKVVDQDRISRFGWNLDAAPVPALAPAPVVHRRFECRTCHKRYQLADLPEALGRAVQQTMVQWGSLGHQGLEAEIAVRGVCAQCGPH